MSFWINNPAYGAITTTSSIPLTYSYSNVPSSYSVVIRSDLIKETPSITVELVEAFFNWFKSPNDEETSALSKLLLNHRQTWAIKIEEMMSGYDTRRVYIQLVKDFPFLTNMPVIHGHRKRFEVSYCKFVVFKFVTNEIDKTTEMTYEYTMDKHNDRKITRGPITTEIFVIQTPFEWLECFSILGALFRDKKDDINYIKEWCKARDIKPEQLVFDVKMPHVVVTWININKSVYTIIRPLINKDDEKYKPKVDESVMFCNYKYNKNDMGTVFFEGNISDVKEYNRLFELLEADRVNITVQKDQEEKPKEIEQKATEQEKQEPKQEKFEKVKETDQEKFEKLVQENEREKLKKAEMDELIRKRDELTKKLQSLSG